LQIAFDSRGSKNPPIDLPLLLMCYLGIAAADKVNGELMEMRKELNFEGYKFVIGMHTAENYTVGLLSWSGLKDFHPDELRKYRLALFKAQQEIVKLQIQVDKVLQQSALG
jgi:hypothetical protein